jgi:hypothetical protein
MDAAKERPWADHPLYRGMSDEAAGPSWRARQKRLEEEAIAPQENWQSPNGAEDYGLSADAASNEQQRSQPEILPFETFDASQWEGVPIDDRPGFRLANPAS